MRARVRYVPLYDLPDELEKRDVATGFSISLAYSSDARTEIGAFYKPTRKTIRALTVGDILDEQVERKIA
jgi:hypothetical protein